jgi:adenylate kinase
MMTVPEEELVRRSLLRQRADDTEEVIRHRQRVYHERTEPLVSRYRAAGLLREVDGDQPIDEVAAAILEVLA